MQGLTYQNSINQIKECWKGYDVIYSTWKGDEWMYSPDDMVIFSDIPKNPGVKNLLLQKESTIAGLKLAKELGYERALKWRSDMWTNNSDELIKLFHVDSYNTLCWVNHDGGYTTDYFMEDTIDNLLQVWDVNSDECFPERVLTKRIESLGWMNRINYIISDLTPEVDVYWNKPGRAYWMSKLKEQADLYKKEIYGR